MEKYKQNTDIKYIAFGGGGAKGAVYSGVYEAIQSCGLISGASAFSGSSAGSIVATLCACGMCALDYKQLSRTVNFFQLFGKGGLINRDGAPLRKLVNDTIRCCIINFLANHTKRVGFMVELYEKLRDQEYNVTFGDLSELKKLIPSVFKDLIITATDKESGKLAIFRTDDPNCFDVPIADAVRASCSIPLFLKPHKIGESYYIDGAVSDMIPIRYFEYQNFDDGEVLCFAFDKVGYDDGAARAVNNQEDFAILSYSLFVQALNVFMRRMLSIGQHFDYVDARDACYNAVRMNAKNTVILSTGDVDFVSFRKATKYAKYMHVKGYVQTTDFLQSKYCEIVVDPYLEIKKRLLKVYEHYKLAKPVVFYTKYNAFNKILDICENDDTSMFDEASIDFDGFIRKLLA